MNFYPGDKKRFYCWMCKQAKAPDYFTIYELTHHKQPFCEDCYEAAECTDRPTSREWTQFGVEMQHRGQL